MITEAPTQVSSSGPKPDTTGRGGRGRGRGRGHGRARGRGRGRGGGGRGGGGPSLLVGVPAAEPSVSATVAVNTNTNTNANANANANTNLSADTPVFVPSTINHQYNIINKDINKGGRSGGRGGRGRGRASTSKDGMGKYNLNSNSNAKSQEATSNDTNKPNNNAPSSKTSDNQGKKKINKNQNKKDKNPFETKQQDERNKSVGKNGDSGVAMPHNDDSKDKEKKAKQYKQETKSKGNSSQNTDSGKSFTPKSKSSVIPPNQPQQTNDINYGRGQKITIFHVAEKPSIAQAIANGLSKGDVTFKKKSLPVHEFTNPSFPKAPHASSVFHRVSSVAGHVFSVDFPSKFQSWESVDPLELFQAPVVRKPCKGSVVKHLQDEAKGCDFIVLWMDCDREGENINFEVLDCCMHLMKGGTGVANYDRVYRAYFSAINPSDIQKAYQNLGKPDKNQALSVDARQELDLKVGVAFSRFQTRFFQGRYGDLDSSVVSYGPCQTPTLGFCVQRHIDIETFKPEPYWVLELGVLKRGRMLRATWEAGRSFNKNKTESLIEMALEQNSSVVVTSVVIKEKKQGRPVPLNTIGLLKACSKALGIGPHAAMQAAERLYLSGYLSYPRTESTAYPKSFDIRGTLQQQTSDGRWGNHVRELLAQGHTKSRGGVDMGDHPPITPCRTAGLHELSGDMGRIFELVVRHFIASVSPDAEWQSTKIGFEIEALGPKGKFYLSGKQLVSPGFLAILLHKEYGDNQDDNAEEDEEERQIPEFAKGEIIPLLKSNSSAGSSKVIVATSAPVWASLDIKEKMTVAPGYLTESELIGMMEKFGIGTDASISTHIQNIQNRNYVRLESGRRLIPNKLGMVLVQGYHQIDSGLVLPKVRSDIEGECNRIAKGDAQKDDVVRRAIEIFEQKFGYFVKHIDRMDVLFSSSFSKLEDVGKAFTRCGLTRRYLQMIPGPPPRLYNRFTENVYPLPVGGETKQWSGRSCPVNGCNFELCLYSVGAPPRTFPLCPNCFNSPDWALADEDDEANEDLNRRPRKDIVDMADEHKENQIKKMAGKALTLECPLPDEHPLIQDLYVSPDPDSDGIFILDPHFGPKWRLVSTRDATIIHFPKGVDKITVLDEREEVLGCHKIKVEFKDGQSPLPDGSTKFSCFYPTDSVLQGNSRVFHGSERTASKGRGRGRGGRSRGRGRGGRGGRS